MNISHVSKLGVFFISLLFLTSCTSNPTISIFGMSIADRLPENGQVHAYPNLPEIDHHLGPYYVLHIRSKDDIPKLASEFTHHLYFSLIPCSQTEHGYDLWSGGVFIDSDANNSTNALDGTQLNVGRYMIHVPINAKSII